MPKAVVCRELGPPENLRLETFDAIPLAPGQVRVAIRAAVAAGIAVYAGSGPIGVFRPILVLLIVWWAMWSDGMYLTYGTTLAVVVLGAVTVAPGASVPYEHVTTWPAWPQWALSSSLTYVTAPGSVSVMSCSISTSAAGTFGALFTHWKAG